MLTGHPSSGKTLLAMRLVLDNQDFVRISGDDLHAMFLNEPAPSRDEDLLYSTLALIRDDLLRQHRSIVIDTTAPTNRTRSYLIRTSVPNVDRLLIVTVASRESLLERTRAKGHFGAVEAWDRAWEPPADRVPTFKFRGDKSIPKTVSLEPFPKASDLGIPSTTGASSPLLTPRFRDNDTGVVPWTKSSNAFRTQGRKRAVELIDMRKQRAAPPDLRP